MNFSDIEREFREKFGEHTEHSFWRSDDTGFDDEQFDLVLAFFKAKHDAYQQWLVEEIEKKKTTSGFEEQWYCPKCDAKDYCQGYCRYDGKKLLRKDVTWFNEEDDVRNNTLSDIQELVKGNNGNM